MLVFEFCVYLWVRYAICGLFSTDVLFIYTVLFTSLSRVEADRVYGVISRAKLSTIDLTSWRQCALFWTAVIFCACTIMYALNETSVRELRCRAMSIRPMHDLWRPGWQMGFFVRFTDLCTAMTCWPHSACWKKHVDLCSGNRLWVWTEELHFQSAHEPQYLQAAGDKQTRECRHTASQ